MSFNYYPRKRQARMVFKDKLFGDRTPSNLHDHVILPKKVTDDFYSTWTQCYEELFHASLSPKYIQRKDSTASRESPKKTQYFRNGLKHSVSDLHLAQNCDESVPARHPRPSHRLSLDMTNMNLNFKDDAVVRRHQRHMSDPEPMKTLKCGPGNVTEKTNLAKLFGAFNGRKKIYKLSETSSIGPDITE